MKITFLGTSTMSSSGKNTSFVIDDHILIDIGNGVLNQLRENALDTNDIDTLLITHFHCDHFGDLIYYIFRHAKKSKHKLLIIGPKGCRQKVTDLYNVFFSNYTELYEIITRKIEIVELADGKSYKNKIFTITAFAVDHGGNLNCNGYIITKDKASIGCTGDTTMCANLVKNIGKAQTWIMEATVLTQAQARDGHTGLDEIEKIAAKHPSRSFYAVHRQDYETGYQYTDKNVILPKENQTFFIGEGNTIVYKKLVRDNIPQIITTANKKEVPITRVLDGQEFIRELNKKLQEEVTEYIINEKIEELADILEVIHGILISQNKTFADLEKARLSKKKKRGGFEGRVFLESVKKGK